MIYWIGGLSTASDARLFSTVCETFEVLVRPTATPNDRQFHCRRPRALILNLQTSFESNAALLDAADRTYPGTPIVVKTAVAVDEDDPALQHPSIVARIEDHTPSPDVVETLKSAIKATEIISPQTPESERPAWRRMLIGESPAIEVIANKIALIADRRSTVMITGETGTGKEVVARAIHAASSRCGQPLVTVNCGALPESLLEAELFGHAKGAFTGAVGQRMGRFEQANRGTIFLDEIGDMPVSAQTTLLRVLQEREFHRVGGVETVHVDVRVLAATNVDLQTAVDNKTFRPDLLYRLHVFPIYVPPLRDRLCDVEPLAEHFIQKVCTEEGLPIKRLSPAALARLSNYDWPGNVRQLSHAIEMALVTSGDRTTLSPDDFSLPEREESAPLAAPEVRLPDEGVDFEELVNEVQRGILQLALNRAGGNKSRAASLLHMKRSTLVSKVKALAG